MKPDLKKTSLKFKKQKKLGSNKFRKKYKLYSTLRFVGNSRIRYPKLKFLKTKIKTFKKYYCNLTRMSIKNFNNLVAQSIKKKIFLPERQLNVFIARHFGNSILKRRKDIETNHFLVNEKLKCSRYVLKDGDNIRFIPNTKNNSRWRIRRIKNKWAKKLSPKKWGKSLFASKKRLSFIIVKEAPWNKLQSSKIWKPRVRNLSSWQVKLPWGFKKRFKSVKMARLLLYNKKL